MADSSPIGPPPDPIAVLRLALRSHYDIEREIGQGAFATVYLARDLKHERKVAIKVLHADPTSETGELRFIREIRLLARLQHPNILPLHDSGHVETLLYYVMPYVSGETLRDRMDREKQLSLHAACNILRDIADALAYAHGQGIIHRDIKPENILLSAGHPILADFGIARVLGLAGVRQLTRTGMGSPGTPAYMSPEQLLGESEIDARSDIYSAGCVLYEMVSGKPPFLGKEGFAKRFLEPPPAPSTVRRGIPTWLDEVLAKTVARDPRDRYPSAAALVHALTLGLSNDRGAAPSPDETHLHKQPSSPRSYLDKPQPVKPRPRRQKARPRSAESSISKPDSSGQSRWATLRNWARARPRILAASAIALILFGAVGAFKRPSWSRAFAFGAAIDSTRLAILPFAASGDDARALGAEASNALYDTFSSWDGLNLVPDLKVEEAIGENGRQPATLREALSLARRLGAGRVVWGHVLKVGGSLRARAELYDLTRPTRSVREVILDPPPESGSYANTAVMLLAPPDRPVAALGGDGLGLSRSYPAWQAYNRGHVALRNWDLRRAQAEFEKAVAADPTYPTAQLWLGQVLAWQHPLAQEGWRQNAERAAAAAPRMTKRDSLLSIALAAMASKRYPVACESYRAITRSDSLDFIGWYGLGECQGLDHTVLPDPTSASGWRWRSSYDAAVKAFARALRLEPGAHALLTFDRLRRLLPTAASNPRVDDWINTAFAAQPSLSGDTVAFVPYPVSVFAKGLPPSATATLNQALNRNLDILYELATNWVRLSPQSADAYEALADVLETRGDIFERDGPAISALTAVHRSMALSDDSQQLLRLVAREARVRFKRGDYRGARRIADSLFTNRNVADRNDPPVLISLAALTGRIEITAQLARAAVVPAKVQGIAIPPALREVSASLFANAALGVCGDTLIRLREQLERDIQSSVPEQQREKVRTALTTRPLSMMVPCTRGTSALKIVSPISPLYRLQQAFARQDSLGVRRRLREMAESQRSLRPTDLSPDYIYQETWLRAAMGDTAGALSRLDRSLNAISNWSAPALREPAASAAIGRAIALRAELAAGTGDSASARRWAKALNELWANADPPLQRTVSRINGLTAAGR